MKSEHEEQCEVIRWRDAHSLWWPGELELLHAIPNGGKRNIITAVKLKREGVLAGIPDLMLPVARYDSWEAKVYHGLYIEMKKNGGRPTISQKLKLTMLTRNGYRAVWHDNASDAIEEIKRYLELSGVRDLFER